MPTYTVRWEIDIDAPDAALAARRALQIQRNPDSTATVFECIPHDADHGNRETIDAADHAPVDPLADWYREHDAQASEEGWSIFETNRRPFVEIERIDDAGVFETDDDALAHVIARAEDGDACALDALAVCAVLAETGP